MQSTFAPLHLKGEIMDLEFSLSNGLGDTDHRKRRRNRTTQSCLNCHTSKRKCDRKRPCQRCIQLGLTGLCVYEIDDPALRDDPSVDENTRLRNRIAELESLVRELRGKPHPRWADSNFRDGDPNEKWHSRATKCAPLPLNNNTSSLLGSAHPSLLSSSMGSPAKRRGDRGGMLPPIKTEMPPDHDPTSPLLSSSLSSSTSASPNLYRFSNSPGRYFPDSAAYSEDDFYPPSSSMNGIEGEGRVNGNGNDSDDCPCRASPGMAHAYLVLAQALNSTLTAARTYAPHQGAAQERCSVYRRVVELVGVLGCVYLPLHLCLISLFGFGFLGCVSLLARRTRFPLLSRSPLR
ncbi:hypothetical protein C8R45DRAFT_816166 [Mycena sanguinolenta]|nr:hypothetical protein C8R45DRAFT_816166 [Mycena sanguinolenta]